MTGTGRGRRPAIAGAGKAAAAGRTRTSREPASGLAPARFSSVREAALVHRAAAMLRAARRRGLSVVVAESCTAGQLSCLLASCSTGAAFAGAFVVYTKAQKTLALGVPAALLRRCSVVSDPVAAAMARGALRRSRADIAIAITGVAGPHRDADGNPVGLVHIAVAVRRGEIRGSRHAFGALSTAAILRRTIGAALALASAAIRGGGTRRPGRAARR